MLPILGLAKGGTLIARAMGAALSTGVGRVATGAVVGGVAGALGGNNNLAETDIMGATEGALLGAGIGALTTRAGLGAIWGAARGMGRMGRGALLPRIETNVMQRA